MAEAVPPYAPFVVILGERGLQLLSKSRADASTVITARAAGAGYRLAAQQVVAAQMAQAQVNDPIAPQSPVRSSSPRPASPFPISSEPLSIPASSPGPSPSSPARSAPRPVVPSLLPTARDSWGCFGVLSLPQGPQLIAITGAQKLGASWQGRHELYALTRVSFVPVSAVPLFQVTEEERKREAALVEKLTALIEESGFYFSHSYDITNSAQRQAARSAADRARPLHELADARFFWNHFLHEDFRQLQLHDWILPVMQGFVSVIDATMNGAPFQYLLVSRRSRFRTGPRLHMRGADYEGTAAAFCETEQSVWFTGGLSSFVQVRGSIPLLWHQLDRKAMKPKPVVDNSADQRAALQQHFEALRALYGPVTVVSLLDQTGLEADLAEAYETYVRLLDDAAAVSYVGFDFHEICKGGKYENISVLVQQVRADLAEHGYFSQGATGDVLTRQSGVMRVNCLDCLDRTNVVQSVFAHVILRNQLESLGLLQGGDPIESHAEFEAAFKNAWADNADSISKEYTGTGALKTTFTRTGQWTVGGALLDGMTSAKRYVNQTVYDDEKLRLQYLLLGVHRIYRASEDLAECAQEGVFRFSLQKQQLGGAEPVVVEVDVMSGNLTQFALKDGTKRVRPLRSLHQLAKAPRHARWLRLCFCQNPAPKDFEFRDAAAREQCVQAIRSGVIVQMQRLPTSPPRLPALLQPAAYDQEVKFFAGYWNMQNEANPCATFDTWLPRGQDIYAVAAHNCSYSKAPGYYFSTPAHFFFSLQQHLGPDYERLAASQVDGHLLIVLVHRVIAPFVTMPEVHLLKERPADAQRPPKSAQQQQQGSSPGGGFFGRLLGREGRAQTPEPKARPSELLGVAIGCLVHDTSVCFLSLGDKDASGLRADGIDLFAAYAHLFWLGCVAALDDAHTAKWTELARHPTLSQRTAILWRAQSRDRLYALNPVSPQAASTSPDQSFSAPSSAPEDGQVSPSPASPAPSLRSSSRAAVFLSELATTPPPSPPPSKGSVDPPPPVSPSPLTPSAAAPSPSLSATPPITGRTESPIRRKSSRAAEFLLAMNKSEAADLVVQDDSPHAPAGALSELRRSSSHRRALSDGGQIFAQQRRNAVPPLAVTCKLLAVCDLYRAGPACRIFLTALKSANLRLAPSVAPLKGEIFLTVEASFLNTVRTKAAGKPPGSTWTWEDTELAPFITDPEYLRRRSLRLSAWDTDVLGNVVRIGVGRIPLADIASDALQEIRCVLSDEDALAGIVSVSVAARFLDWGDAAKAEKRAAQV